jgi:hypothetical protein
LKALEAVMHLGGNVVQVEVKRFKDFCAAVD